MNRDEITKMPAGQEMDILIAEKVLKITTEQWNEHFFRGASRFSVDMEPAFVVLQMLRPEYSFQILSNMSNGDYFVALTGVGSNKKFCFATAETVPLAICRAALFTIEGEER